jgi:hypothetical protein
MKCLFCGEVFALSELPDPKIACCWGCGQLRAIDRRQERPTMPIPLSIQRELLDVIR